MFCSTTCPTPAAPCARSPESRIRSDKFDVDSVEGIFVAQAADMLKEAGAKRVIGEFSLLRFCVEPTFKYFKLVSFLSLRDPFCSDFVLNLF